jgi:hypothetical protein
MKNTIDFYEYIDVPRGTKLTKVQKSNARHSQLALLNRKFATTQQEHSKTNYHDAVRYHQEEQNRILSKTERKEFYNNIVFK